MKNEEMLSQGAAIAGAMMGGLVTKGYVTVPGMKIDTFALYKFLNSHNGITLPREEAVERTYRLMESVGNIAEEDEEVIRTLLVGEYEELVKLFGGRYDEQEA
jgi:hypothetical protein